jgi:hypothetical protein
MEETIMSVTGHCLCGAVKIAAQGEPIFVGKCYCTDCQRGSGGHSTVVAYPEPVVTVSGPLAKYMSKGDSGQDVTRGFCPTCGTRVYTSAAVMPGVTLVQAGVINEGAAIVPTLSIFAASAVAWDMPPANIPSCPGAPPAPN